MADRLTMPVGFVAHGAPMLALEEGKAADLKRWADSMPRPKAILVVSAHWEQTPPTLGTSDHSRLIYDFYGFPQALYQLTYHAPGISDNLRAEVMRLLGEGVEVQQDASRGLDHGAWVPLRCMYPAADIPVLQVSLPSRWDAARIFDFGRALAPLRAEGVLILGSGSLVHNLRRVDFNESSAPPDWAVEFDGWCRDVMQEWRIEELLDYRSSAPSLALAQPTVEHFLPLIVAAGAASEGGDGRPAVVFPVDGFEYGSISRRCVQIG